MARLRPPWCLGAAVFAVRSPLDDDDRRSAAVGFPSHRRPELANGCRYHEPRHGLTWRTAAHRLDDLLVPPSNRLVKLKGNLKGFFSIRVNDQWRVIFKWIDGDAYEVRVVDYH